MFQMVLDHLFLFVAYISSIFDWTAILHLCIGSGCAVILTVIFYHQYDEPIQHHRPRAQSGLPRQSEIFQNNGERQGREQENHALPRRHENEASQNQPRINGNHPPYQPIGNNPVILTHEELHYYIVLEVRRAIRREFDSRRHGRYIGENRRQGAEMEVGFIENEENLRENGNDEDGLNANGIENPLRHGLGAERAIDALYDEIER